MIDKIMECLNDIEYGYKDSSGFNIINDKERWDNEFEDFYSLLSPEELLITKCGTCWEQVELERKLFIDNNIKCSTYFICTYASNGLPCHTFLVYEDNNKYNWFEHSWYDASGIHEYNTLEELLLDVKKRFIDTYKEFEGPTFVIKYNKPKYHISCNEMYEYMETQELIKLNKSNYYYLTNYDKNKIIAYKENNNYLYKININDEYFQRKIKDINIFSDYVEIDLLDDITKYLERCE